MNAQKNFTKERGERNAAERKRQAEVDRADVQQKLDAQAQQKAVRLQAVAEVSPVR